EKTFDALAEFLHSVHVRLRHPPRAVGRVGRTGLEGPDLFLHPEIPGDVGDEVPDVRKGLHRLDGHRLVEGQVAQPGHAHQARQSVDLGGAGTAFAGLAVPAAGEVIGLAGLDAVHGVEHDHAFADLARVGAECSAALV